MKCRACEEEIQLLPNEKGKLAPHDFVYRSHYSNPRHIAAVRKNGAKPKRGQVSRPPEQVVEAAKLLREMGYKREGEAEEMLRDVPEGPPEAMVPAAITKMGAE